MSESETPDSGRPVREWPLRAPRPLTSEEQPPLPEGAPPEALSTTRRIAVIERRSAPLVTYTSSTSLPPSTPPSRAPGARDRAADSEGSSDGEDSSHRLNEQLASHLDTARALVTHMFSIHRFVVLFSWSKLLMS